jgi:hypothetical protein
MKTKVLLIGALLVAMAGTEANAAVISSNTITGKEPDKDDPYVTGLYTDANVTASGIGRGTGILKAKADDTYAATGFTTGATIDANDYFTFTLAANSGYKMGFTSFDFYAQVDKDGPTTAVLRSSLDGYASDIGSVLTLNQTNTGYAVNLTGTAYQNLTNPITFRLYGYNAGKDAGTFQVNDYQFNGLTEAVPEPASVALLGIGGLLMGGYMRRTQKEEPTVA